MEPFVLCAGATAENWDYFRTEVAARGEVVRRLAEEYHQFFVPLQARLDEACKLAPIEYWSADGVHPTPAGHQLITNALYEVLTPIL
jgi:lysophospholipase L1-like esterase